jgi:hypothetical protein
MLMIGEEFSEGRVVWDEKEAQYFWSAVSADGASGSLTCCRGVTSAAMVVVGDWRRTGRFGGAASKLRKNYI